MIRREEFSKSFDKDVITRVHDAKKRVNSELKYLNEKLDQCKDTFRGVLLLENIKKKITETEQKEEQKKKQRERKYFKLLHQLLSADLNSNVIDNMNVESLARLSVR